MEEQMQGACVGQKENPTCTSMSTYYADVSVPLKVMPYAVVGTIKTECCGDTTISFRSNQGTGCTCGCEITITQTLCIRIPVEYGTTADAGDTCVVCKKSQNTCNPAYR